MNNLKIENRLSDVITSGVVKLIDLRIKENLDIRDLISSETKSIRKSFTDNLPPGYFSSRKMYRSVGVDPTRYRPSSEALWRRLKKGLELPEINPIVDLTNFLSLKFQIPYGLYDIDKIKGNVVLKKGVKEDFYKGIRKERVNIEGKIALFDDSGPFGNPSSDSLRTSVTGETVGILIIIFFRKNFKGNKIVLKRSVDFFRSFFYIDQTESGFV